MGTGASTDVRDYGKDEAPERSMARRLGYTENIAPSGRTRQWKGPSRLSLIALPTPEAVKGVSLPRTRGGGSGWGQQVARDA